MVLWCADNSAELTGATKVVWSKVIWALEREVIDEPAVTKGTVCT